MIALEIVIGLGVAVLAAAVTWMAIVGLMGVGGMVRLQRCRGCGHLVATPLGQRTVACPICSHPRLAHVLPPVHLAHLLPGEMRPPAGSGGAAAH